MRNSFDELKRAHAEGKTIQIFGTTNVWHDVKYPIFSHHISKYRIKPEESIPMTTPHKHSALIKAWADGSQIQGRRPNLIRASWHDISHPRWEDDMEYRIKSNPYQHLIDALGAGMTLEVLNRDGTWDRRTREFMYPPENYRIMKDPVLVYMRIFHPNEFKDTSLDNNAKVTFDAYTGKLLSVEVLPEK